MPPGERIKLYRRRAGLTQEQAAHLKGCTVSAWRKWESGERQLASLADWVEVARIVRVRDLYKLTGLPVGQLPDEPAEHEAVPAIRAALHAYTPKVEAEPDLSRLADAIEFAWSAWYGSPSRYSRTGPILPDLIHEARAALALSDGGNRQEALRLCVGAHLVVRAFCKRVGALDLATLAADRAMTAAADADNADYRAVAAWNAALVLSTRGHAEDAAALLRDAVAELAPLLDGAKSSRHALYGALHLLLAVQEARLRDERRTTQALRVAEGLAAKLGETSHFRLYFGPTNVDIYRSTIALELSRPSEAQRIAEHVDTSQMPSLERRFSHQLELARAYAIQRDDLAAVHMMLRAERESPEEARLNLVARATVRELLTRETATTRPDLRPLGERLGVLD